MNVEEWGILLITVPMFRRTNAAGGVKNRPAEDGRVNVVEPGAREASRPVVGGLHHLYKLREARDAGLSACLLIIYDFKPINRLFFISRQHYYHMGNSMWDVHLPFSSSMGFDWLVLFQGPRRKQPLVPLLFGGLFFLLGYFPELAWLEKWIEGIDLLLLFLGISSFIEEGEQNQTHPRKKKRTPIPILRQISHLSCGK